MSIFKVSMCQIEFNKSDFLFYKLNVSSWNNGNNDTALIIYNYYMMSKLRDTYTTYPDIYKFFSYFSSTKPTN